MNHSVVLQYIKENQDRFLKELIEWLKIPSISADPAYNHSIIDAATFLKHSLEEIGFENVELCATPGNPVVYAEKIIDKELPTILVYGHYDVQPADPLELWDSPPFEPVVKNNKIFARGACDDKGQVYMHIKALELMSKYNAFACNVKLIIEGEEEIGSDHLEKFISDNKEKLKCDIILISDTSIVSNEHPSLTVGLRGLSYVEVEVTGPNRDLHSGVYGGAVANPINVLCDMIAKMKDSNQHITIPGFYDKVEVLSEDERKALNEIPHDEKEYCEDLKISETMGENGYTTTERTSIRPTLDVNGIWGGYIGEGAKTVLPSKAFAKISMRLVPNQDPEEITKLFSDYFVAIAPNGVKVKVTPHHGGFPVVTPTNSIGYQAAEKAFEECWGKKPIPTREGGSIPIVAMFGQVLEVQTVLMGFGLNSDAIHSPNEHFGVFNFIKGIETITRFHQHYAEAFKRN
jgi:acetylornithine deacetylase/succinyl-diaminopimelate desuccinylase-like protein